MRRKGKIIVAINLILIFMLTIMLQSVHAETITGSKKGVTWSFDSETGTLTFSGSGMITDDWGDNIEESSVLNVTINEGITSIGFFAFDGCSSLTSIEIPNSVTSIGRRAFSSCSGLTSIEIPDSVIIIGDYAFSGCSSLTSIEIPDSVIIIGDGAFDGCSSLTSIEIPDSVIIIGDGAFSRCSNLTGITVGKENKYYCSENGVLFDKSKTILIKYLPEKEDGSYTIPNGVTSIGNYAFYRCSNLTSINIPNGITSIGKEAFYGCKSLTSINIPNGVTSIERSTFYDCESLTSITIPDSVTSIESNAFDGCRSLTSITIPDSVTSIESDAFRNCRSLTSITIPDSVTSIENRVFLECSSLTSIEIPDSVSSIKWDAFDGCSSLTSIEIPDSVSSIRVDGLFYGLNNLTNIIVGKENKNYCSENGILFNKDKTAILIYPEGKKDNSSYKVPDSVTSIGDFAFQGCSNLTSITIGNSVTSIGTQAFYECSNLTSINIPDRVTSIGDRAFYECSNLTSIEIPDSVTSIGEDAFYTLTSIIVDEHNKNYCSENGVLFNKDKTYLIKYPGKKEGSSYVVPNSVKFVNKSAFSFCRLENIEYSSDVLYISASDLSCFKNSTSAVLPNGISSIGANAFDNCSSLTSIEIPDSVTSIEEDAFYRCGSLTSIVVCNENKNYSSGNGVLFNKDKTEIIKYPKKKEDSSYKIPDSVTSIEEDAFYKCGSLTSINIPDTVTSIGDGAFCGCSGLTSINIPDSVTSIGDFAFQECSNLTSITIGNSVTSIGTQAFYGCRSLTSINIPDTVTSIGNRAFCGCSGLTSINIPDSVTSIGDRAFYECSNLTSINIPDTVTSIGDGAFNGCGGLTSIIVGAENKNYCSENGVLFNKDKIEIIQYPAKKENSSYKIPDSVTSIGDGAFNGCGGLTSINIPNSVTSIGYRGFYGCGGLTSISIPDSVTSIGANAFYHCNSLTIYCKSNSIAKSDAVKENIKYIVDDNEPEVTLSQENSYINIVATDSGVGLGSLPYSIDGINWTKDNKIAVDKTGEYIVYVRDLVGNVAREKIIVDFDKPEIIDVSANRYKITITAKDNLALAEEAYSLDGENYQKSNVLSVKQNGTYTIYVKDSRGNVASKEIYIVDGNMVEKANLPKVVVHDGILAEKLQQVLGSDVISVENKFGRYEILIASNNIYSIDLSATRDQNGRYKKIKDIRGLEGFKNLTSLNLNNNEVQNLSELKNNKKLRTLSIRYNNLKDLECVKDINSLVQLDASRNEIEDISALANLTNLETLILNNNTIGDGLSPLNELQNLQILNISENLITDLSGLNKLKLKELYCSHNQVKDISPINKENLKKFEMKHNCVYIYFNDTDSGIEIPSLLQYEIEKSGGTDNLRMEVATIENNKIVIPRNGSEVKPEVDIRVKSGDFEGSGFLLRNNKFYVPGEVTIHKFKVDDGSINAELWSTDARFGINKNSSDNDDWQAVNDKSTGYRKNYTYNVENERVNAYNIYKDSQGYNMLGEDIEDLVINIDDVVNKNIPDLKLSYSTAEYTNKDVVVTISSSENLCIDPNNNERNWKLSEDKKSMTCTLSENAKFDVDVMLEKDYQSVGNYNDIHKEKVVVNVMNIDKEVGTTFHNGITYFFDYKDIHENSAYITLEADEPIEVVKTSGKVVEGGRRHVLSRPLYHVKIYYKHDVNEIVEVKDRCSNIRKYEVNIKGVDGEVDGLNVSNKTNVATKPNIKINVYANEPIKIEKNTPLRMPKVKIASRAVDTEESITNADDGISTHAEEGIPDEEYKEQHEVTVEENSYGVVKVRDVVGNTDLTVYDVSNIDSAKPIVVEQKEEVLEDGSKRVTLILNEEIKQTDRLNGWIISADGMQISKVFKESTTEKIVIEDLAGNEAEIEVVVDVTKKEPSNEGEQGPKQDNEQDQNQNNKDEKNEEEGKQKFPSRIPQAGKNAIIVGVTFIALVAMSVVLYKKSNKFNI